MTYRPELVHIARTAKPLGATPAKTKASTRTKRNGPSTLSNATVAQIKRELYFTERTHKEIARRYHVSLYQVRNINSGNCYADVDPAPFQGDAE